MKKAKQSWKHERRVRVAAVLPVTVDLVVGTDDDAPDEDTDWRILSVRSANCDATPRMVEENMGDEDLVALARAAAAAEDLK